MTPDNKYVSYLDGLRGYAILFVLLGHFDLAKIWLSRFGVTVFFFVSGFLITKLLIYEYNKKGTILLKEFYLRRIFRLYPALIFMIVLVMGILAMFQFRIIYSDIFSGLFYFTNYYLVYFKPETIPENYLLVSNILWSLSVEEHFYLLFPWLFSLFFSRARGFLWIQVVLLAVILFVRIYTVANLPPSEAFEGTYYPTHTRGDSIIFGCVSALLIFRFNAKWYLKMLRSSYVFWIAMGILAFALLFRNNYFQSTFAYTLAGIGFFIVVPSFSFVNSSGFIFKLVNNRTIIFIGKLSYSLYLFHWVALKVGNLYFAEKNIYWYALVVPATAALSLFSFYLVERPFLALRKKYGSNVKVPEMGSGLATSKP